MGVWMKSWSVYICFLLLSGCIKHHDSVNDVRPNILIAILDDASFEHMSAYGCDWVNTPAFDRVAENGILFMNAYTPNAKCAPSRAAILTGRNSWQLEEAANHWCFFPDKFKTYPEVLIDNGYHVGYTTKGFAPGIPGIVNGKRRELTGKAYNEVKLDPPTPYISGNDYAANFKQFLDDNEEGLPFSFWYGSIEPHRRFEYGSGVSIGGKRTEEIDSVYSFWPDNEVIRNDLLDYAFEIEYFDRHLAYMLDELESRGQLENTIVMVTADNGMAFPRVKGQEYELSNHLPLAIMWAEGIVNPGRKVNDFISFIDFAPTFLEVARIEESRSGMQTITGKSLVYIFNSLSDGVVDPTRDRVLIGKERHDIGRPEDHGYPIRGIVKGDYLLIRNLKTDRWPAGNPETGYLNCDASPTKTVCLNLRRNGITDSYWKWNFGKRPELEFYNIRKDKECVHNLVDNPTLQDVISQMNDQLEKELKEQGDPRIFGNGDIFDKYVYADSARTNFYTKFTEGKRPPTGWVNDSDFEVEFEVTFQ